ncbi:hypothetical protein BC936DRAFT_145141 [Jimgerdemannia flammicorona]|uniref:Uncharacterized protein n=1 Tax=Jimgerdemannia flammicorona TaxID=994334 RepID=A0A433DAV1_9FUNG|nr:hypothetical protein BC936DRAFT_145141 [Jimgerdemannia flammicorona]
MEFINPVNSCSALLDLSCAQFGAVATQDNDVYDTVGRCLHMSKARSHPSPKPVVKFIKRGARIL